MSSSGSRTSTGGSRSGTGPTWRRRRSGNRCVGRSSPLAEATGGPRPARGLRCPEPGRDHPRACASDLEDFRPWCGGRAGSSFRPSRPPVAHACKARAEAFSPVPLGGTALGGCFSNSYRASRPARRVPVSDSRSTSMRFASFRAMVVLSWWPTNAFAPGP